MKLQGAVVKEREVTLAIVIVKSSVAQTHLSANNLRNALLPYFPGLPLILASQDLRGHFSYRGRKDIAAFIARIDARRIPWKQYTFS
jgi:hypothetical protein